MQVPKANQNTHCQYLTANKHQGRCKAAGGQPINCN